MASAPPTLLPANPSEFHAYAFANACLRVYTIVSLRSRLRKDPAAQTEASRGLHWEMAALFDHLSACKMYGPVPIPTAVVPMLTHYTNLYAVTANPAVDIHAFPFEYNEFMEGRGDQIQGNKWWEPLLEPAQEAPQSQLAQNSASAQAHPAQNGEGSHQPMQTDPPQPTEPPAQPPANSPPTRNGEQSPNVPIEAQQPHQNTTLSIAANPQAPFFAVGQSAMLAPTTTPYVPPVHIQHPGAQRFIPYVPPGGAPASAPAAPPAQSAQPSQSAPAGRPAILAPPVKTPRQRRRAVKTSEFVEDEARAEVPATASVSQGTAAGPTGEPAQQENGTGSASVSQAQRKRAPDAVRVEDYTKLHEGASACGNCVTHGRKCLTAKGGRFKRCLECRTRQSKCVWPVSDGATPPTEGGTTPVTEPAAPPPAELAQESASAPAPEQHAPAEAPCASANGRARLVAEVVVTPVRRKRKAAEADASGESPSRRSMRLRGRAPVRREEEEEEDEEPRRSASPLTSVPSSVAEVDAALRGGFEERRAAAHGDAYVRERLALLVDMARTAEMRLADVLGRVAELEAANHRMEKMLAGLGVAAPKTSPRRK